jgi:acetate kinase
MGVLVLNCGSSTLKFQLIETSESGATERKLARGIVDRIGGPASYHLIRTAMALTRGVGGG